MTARVDADVVIVGAGPVGLTLALALTRLGLEVRIIDQDPGTKREQRAGVIWSRGLEILHDLGVVDGFVDRAHPLRSADAFAYGGRLLGRLELGTVGSAFPCPLSIEQHDTERLLAEALRACGVEVSWSHRATAARVFDDHTEIDVVGPDGTSRTMTGAWVVGAEGTRSVVRQGMGVPFEGARRENLQTLQVDAWPTWALPMSPSHVHFFAGPNETVAAFPVPGESYRFFVCLTDPEPKDRSTPTVEQIQDIVARVSGQPDLRLTITEPHWLNRVRFADRVSATLRRGRGLLVGDAAHAWAPIGGQGMNAGIRGAHNLAWKLAAVHRGQAPESLLDTYDVEQRAIAKSILRDMRFNVLEVPLPGWQHRIVRWVLPVTMQSTWIKRRIELKLSNLGWSHQHSALSRSRTRRPIRGGDRIPDVDTDRGPLHRLLGYDHWTLLMLNGAVIPSGVLDSAAQCVRSVEVRPVDAAGRRALGRRPTVVLVRPDNHVGLVAEPTDVIAMRDYVGAFLRGGPVTASH